MIRYRHTGLFAALLAAAVLLSLACGGSGSVTATPSPTSLPASESGHGSPKPKGTEPPTHPAEEADTPAPTEGASPADTAFERYYELNDYDRQGDLTLAVVGWGISHGNERADPKEGHVLLTVDMIIVNHSAQMVHTIDTWALRVRDGQGVETPSTGHFYVPGFAQFPYFSGLASGEGIRHLDVYEVAEGAENYVLVFEPFSLDVDPEDPTFEIPLAKTAVAQQLPAELLAPVPTAHTVGESFSIDGASLTVLGWESVLASNPGDRYVGVDLAIENRGDAPIGLDRRTFLLRDRSGFRHDPYGTSPPDARLGSTIVEIGELFPGEHLRGEVFFCAPASSRDFIFSFDLKGSSGWALDRAFVELGAQPTAGSPPPGFCAQQAFPIHGTDASAEVNGLQISVTSIELAGDVESDGPGRSPASGYQYVTVHAAFENVVSADETWLPEGFPELPPEMATEMPDAEEALEGLFEDDGARERLVALLQLRDGDCRYYALDLCEFEPPVSAQCSMRYLSPGDIFSATIVFQVPLEAQELYLVYSDTFPDDQKVVIELLP
jgi:hypothetical protein